MNDIAAEIIDMLRDRKLTLGTVESATGGLIAHMITNIPGSSDVFPGSIVSYSNEIKMKIVGVKKTTLEKYGAVSSQVAFEMAAGGRKTLRVDICVADTGIAGPGGATPGKPVGLFYLGLSIRDGTSTQKHLFTGSREENKQQAAETALMLVLDYLKKFHNSRRFSRGCKNLFRMVIIFSQIAEVKNVQAYYGASGRLGTGGMRLTPLRDDCQRMSGFA